MILVEDIYDEAQKIVGSCDEVKLFRWITDAVSLIANKEDLEGWKGFCDICANYDQCVTLPREVETVIAVNIGGRPTFAHDQLFNFHLNGPGDCKTPCSWTWQDQAAFHCTYRDLKDPALLVAYLQRPSDAGKRLIVFGYDDKGYPLQREENGTWVEGYLVPTVYGYALPDSEAPLVSRITAVQKDVTDGVVRLSTTDDSGVTGTLLGVYEPDERLPRYRRIKLSRPTTWARIAYLKKNPEITSRRDHVPMLSRIALLLAVRALKYYNELDLGSAHTYEADAARLEMEAQTRLEPPIASPLQVVDMNNPRNKLEFEIT